jgi:3-dehydroquinate dehydratase-2
MTNQSTKPSIWVIHGPNLNLLGGREPDIYGRETLDAIDAALHTEARKLGLRVEPFQSNHEGAIVERIQLAAQTARGMIINPAAYTHTSIAIRDALLLLEIPVVEVHLSNVHRREGFRQRSLISDVVTGHITGLGGDGYILALHALSRRLQRSA